MRLGPLPNSSLAKAGPGVTACRQRSQVFCAGDALSKFEYRFPEGDRQRSKEKTSRDSFFVHVRLVYRRQGAYQKRDNTFELVKKALCYRGTGSFTAKIEDLGYSLCAPGWSE